MKKGTYFLSIVSMVIAVYILGTISLWAQTLDRGLNKYKGLRLSDRHLLETESTLSASYDSLNVRLVGRWPYGPCEAVAVQGDYAYIGSGAMFIILDISEKTNPTMLGSVYLLDSVEGIAISGSYAYVADGDVGLRVINVSVPTNPQEVGFYDTPGSAINVALSGSYAYVADGSGGLRVINVSDPTNPQEVGFYDTSGSASGVALSGSYAYVADYDAGLRVINVWDPTNPQEVGFYDTPDIYLVDIALDGAYAYGADVWYGLRVIDVSDPTNPWEMSSYETWGSPLSVALSPGWYAFVAVCEWGLRVIDISDPTNLHEVGSFDFGAKYCAKDITLSDTYAYVAYGGTGLRVIHISDPTNPNEVGFYNTPDISYNVALSGSYAYVANRHGGIRVINISVPTKPYEIGFYDTPGLSMDVVLSGSYAYVADYVGLQVIDVSDPANPWQVGFYDTPGYAYGVALSGSYAYVADYDAGLRVIDVSDPTNPHEVTFYDTPGYAVDVVIYNLYAYVADFYKGLRVIDVSDPTNIDEVGFYDTPDRANGIALYGNYAYIADGSAGIRVINVFDPTNPQEAGFYDSPDYAYGVAMYGTCAHVANDGSGMWIFEFIAPELNPPQNLYAFNGYNSVVPLAWGAPEGYSPLNTLFGESETQKESLAVQNVPPIKKQMARTISSTNEQSAPTQTLLSYNVYRSDTPGAPYTLIASSVARQYYRDETVTNGNTYYYVVTAVYDEGESNYSNEDDVVPVEEGYYINSGWADTPPTLDGFIDPTEWADAVVVDITHPGYVGPVTLYAMNDNGHLYLAVDDPGDTTLDDHDCIGSYFDEDHNHEWPPSSPSGEGVLWAQWFGGASSAWFRGVYGWWPKNIGVDTPVPAPGVNQAISNSSGHVQFEVDIDLVASDLNAAAGEVIGWRMYSTNNGLGTGEWPQELAFCWHLGDLSGLPAVHGDLELAADVSQSITVTSPNGGEIWIVGSTQDITWTSNGSVDNVKIEYSTDNGANWGEIIASTPDDGEHEWIIPAIPSLECLVKISDAIDGEPSDVSDSTFVIGSKGDINGDGVVDIFDLVKLINFILEKVEPDPYEFWAGDINDDGVLDIFDVVKIIKIILGGDITILAKMAVSSAQIGVLSLPDVELVPDHITEVPIYANFDGTVAGIQLVLHYDPQILKLSTPNLTSRTEQMELATADKNGKLTILIYSASGHVIEAGDGAILNFTVQALSGFKGATQLEVENAIVVNGKAEIISMDFSSGNITAAKPQSYFLSQNYPNPFNAQTMIRYQLPKSDRVVLKIYNTLGQEIRTLVDEEQEGGYYNISWDGRNNDGMMVSSGIYIYKMQTQEFVKVRKLLFVM